MRTRRSSQDAEEAEADGQINARQEEEGNTSESDQNNDNDGSKSGSGSEDESSSDDDDDSSSSDDEEDDSNNSSSQAEVSQEEIQHAIALASEAARKTFGWDALQKDKANDKSKSKGRNSKFGGPGEGNALSDLIPGYTAPMRLEVTYAKSADTSSGGAASAEQSLQEMRRRAQRTDRSTASHVISSGAQSYRADAMRHRRPGSSGASSFKMGTKRGPDGTAGQGWFGMAPAALTDDVKADIAIIRNRTYLDPKRFYKKADIMDPKMVQVGTVIEGSEEYYSSRLTKKQRRQNLAEEIMADADVKKYAKRQFTKIQDSRQKRFGQGYGRKKQRTGRKGRR